ncbi:MAG TPA: hypothetical protein VLM38_04100 [Blastocatellia bacterium]|nr:hypothetical protein [Blastocatellia bacterium]
MKIKTTLISVIIGLMLAVPVTAQESGGAGFVISLKNGSTIRGRTLARDESTGKLRLSMTEVDGEARSYAVIAPEDTTEIRSSASDGDSIRIRLKGGSDLRCKEFSLNGDSVSVKLGSASKVDVRWTDIESISFVQ